MANQDDEMAQAEREKLRIPDISRELVKWLRAVNPQRVIGRNETLTEAHRRAGEQDLIDRLDFLSLQQARYEAGELSEGEANVLVWEAPDTEEGYVLRATS